MVQAPLPALGELFVTVSYEIVADHHSCESVDADDGTSGVEIEVSIGDGNTGDGEQGTAEAVRRLLTPALEELQAARPGRRTIQGRHNPHHQPLEILLTDGCSVTKSNNAITWQCWTSQDIREPRKPRGGG